MSIEFVSELWDEQNIEKLDALLGEIEEEREEEVKKEENEDVRSSTRVMDCKLIGSLFRESKDPLSQLCVDSTCSVFSSHSASEKHVELYKINTIDEIKKKLAKKLKKQKRKLV